MKYSGVAGYSKDVEISPGIWESQIHEVRIFGDVLKNRTSIQQQSNINGEISINHSISIVSNPFIRENCFDIRYVTFMGKKWCITSVEIEFPRIILSLGGLYNE